MAAIAATDPVHVTLVRQRQSRNDGHPVITFLAAIGVMRPPRLGKRLCREMRILGLCLLKSQNVDVGIFEEIPNKIDSQPDRIDVPCHQFHVDFLASDSDGNMQKECAAPAVFIHRHRQFGRG